MRDEAGGIERPRLRACYRPVSVASSDLGENPARACCLACSMKRALLALTAAAAASIALSGCGSSEKSSGTTTQASAAVTWAGGVCSAVTSYKSSLHHAGSTLKNGALSKSAVKEAAGSVRDATQTFITSVDDLGKPGTAAGKHAKSTIDALASDLQKDVKAMQDAVSGSSVLTAVSVASTTLLTAQTQVKSAVDELQATDAKGELHNAFATAPSCSSSG
jgi:hypothetical protein